MIKIANATAARLQLPVAAEPLRGHATADVQSPVAAKPLRGQ
jgi:hypothetical protein